MAWEDNAHEGDCTYCGKHGKVMEEPFGQKPACKGCWQLICFGSEEDE